MRWKHQILVTGVDCTQQQRTESQSELCFRHRTWQVEKKKKKKGGGQVQSRRKTRCYSLASSWASASSHEVIGWAVNQAPPAQTFDLWPHIGSGNRNKNKVTGREETCCFSLRHTWDLTEGRRSSGSCRPNTRVLFLSCSFMMADGAERRSWGGAAERKHAASKPLRSLLTSIFYLDFGSEDSFYRRCLEKEQEGEGCYPSEGRRDAPLLVTWCITSSPHKGATFNH